MGPDSCTLNKDKLKCRLEEQLAKSHCEFPCSHIDDLDTVFKYTA